MLTQRGDEKSQVTMSDSQKTDPTTIVINQRDGVSTPTKSGKLTKKHVLIAVVSLVITGLVVIAVLVGIHLVMQSNQETLRLSLSMKTPSGANLQQTVSTDDNANIVVSHVVADGTEIFINDDFDKDIQLIKMISGSTVGCFITPLNRSNAFDPKQLPQLAEKNISSTMRNYSTVVHLSYDVAPTPINNTLFLGKRANALCNNIPVYWLQPTCSVQEYPLITPTTAMSAGRSKRTLTIGPVSCNCGWKYCTGKIFGKTFSYTCGYQCTCCMFGKCLQADVGCVGCLIISFWDFCVSPCNAIAAALNALFSG